MSRRLKGARGGFNHMTLSVSDLAGCEARFYAPVLSELGYDKVEDRPGQYTVWFNAAAVSAISLSQAERQLDGPFDRYKPGFHHCAFWADSPTDVDVFHRRLLDWNVRVLDAPAAYPDYGPGYYAVFFSDPDGLKFEFTYQEIEAEAA